MSKRFFLIPPVFFLYTLICFSQNSFPTYPQILHEFFSKYSYQPDSTEELQFAKKKDGWYVRIVDTRKNNIPYDEKLFWSSDKNKFEKISGMGESGTEQIDSIIESYLTGNPSYNFYGYERCRYFGYNNWAKDMINDFENYDGISDTLLDGLARAYSFYARSFVYENEGTTTETDSLHRPLGRLEMPSPARVNMMKKYKDKSISTYKRLQQSNPAYKTIIGNSAQKLINEQIDAYLRMLVCGNKQNAAAYLRQIAPDEGIIALGKSYLAGCLPNSIVFSFGDNDTYPLWYVQEKLNFRKDVTVINHSMLALPKHVSLLKKEGKVNFSSTSKNYGYDDFNYSLFDPESSGSNEILDLREFIQMILTKKYHTNNYGEQYTAFSSRKIKIRIDPTKFAQVSKQKGLANIIELNLGYYIGMDDFIMLDIINSNIYDRAIYFTSTYGLITHSLQMEGMLYRLLPLDQKESESCEISIRQTENFVSNELEPMFKMSPNVKKELISQTISLIPELYITIANFYFLKGDSIAAKKWLKKTVEMLKEIELPLSNSIFTLSNILFKMGDKDIPVNFLEQLAEKIYDLYQTPSPLYIYINKSTAISTIAEIESMLRENNRSSEKIDKIAKKLSD